MNFYIQPPEPNPQYLEDDDHMQPPEEWDDESEFDDEDPRNICPYCHGTGVFWDGPEECEHCDGQGYYWWL